MSETPPMGGDRPLPGSRDRTPELTAKREKRHREDDEDDRDRRSHRHRHDDRERDRDRSRDYDRDRERDRDRRRHDDETEEEREERRRRRREREREREMRDRDDDSRRDRERDRSRDTNRDRERGSDRDRSRDHDRDRSRDHDRDRSRDHDRDRSRDYDRDRDRERDREHRDRDRERRSRDHDDDRRRERSPPRLRGLTREEKERERERRDREMQEERRARRENYHSRTPIEDGTEDKRSVFVAQLAASLSAQDLGLFFEDKLGRGSVRDARLVYDKSRRSKGLGYVELASIDLVSKALALSGTVVMGIPIQINLSDSSHGDVDYRALIKSIRGRERDRRDRDRKVRFPPLSVGIQFPPGVDPEEHAGAAIPYHRVFITNLHESLTREDLRQVFEPFGEIEFVDLHTDVVGNSKGTAYVQFAELASAQMALDAMDRFELAGEKIRVQPVEERSNFDEFAPEGERQRGGRLDAAGRRELMYKLARRDAPEARSAAPKPKPEITRPTHFVMVTNMFNPDEETERNWDLDLAEDVKGEVEDKYGRVARIKVDKMSNGDVYIEFKDIDGAERAQRGLSGRFFGGKQLGAQFISESLFKQHM